MTRDIRIVLPFHLRTLGRIDTSEITLPIAEPVTLRAVIDAIEAAYPMLTGTIRDHGSDKRRPMIRFYACNEDLSHEPMDTVLPERILTAREPLYIIGAIAGG